MRGRVSLAMVSAALLLAGPLLSACGEPAPANKTEVAGAPAQTPVMPEDAPPQEEAEAPAPDGTSTAALKTCAEDIGTAAAAKLVDRCIAVSPATHPPCNAENECALIQGEIDRSCALYGPGETRPAECKA